MVVEHHISVHTIACSGLQPTLIGLRCFTVQSMSMMHNMVCCAVGVKPVLPCRLLTGKTSRNARGLDIVHKPIGVDELGKRQRKKKKARVASPEPDSASQCNSNGHQSTATVSVAFKLSSFGLASFSFASKHAAA